MRSASPGIVKRAVGSGGILSRRPHREPGCRKTVVVLVGSLVLPAGQFQAFLPKADAVLKTLSFPS